MSFARMPGDLVHARLRSPYISRTLLRSCGQSSSTPRRSWVFGQATRPIDIGPD